jgi:hypothetical protein
MITTVGEKTLRITAGTESVGFDVVTADACFGQLHAVQGGEIGMWLLTV